MKNIIIMILLIIIINQNINIFRSKYFQSIEKEIHTVCNLNAIKKELIKFEHKIENSSFYIKIISIKNLFR